MGVFRCCNCEIGGDDFDRDDSTDLGEDWEEVSGDWEIASNKLKTSSAGAICKFQTDYPGGGDRAYVQVTVFNSDPGNVARVLVDYVDQDNYLAFEMEWEAVGVDYIRLIRRSGGGEEVLIERMVTLSSSETVRVCFGEGLLKGIKSSMGVAIEAEGSSNTVALEARVAAGDVSFDDFKFLQHTEECIDCTTPCEPTCTDGLLPDKLQAAVAGIAVQDCADCPDLNGTVLCDPWIGCSFAYTDATIAWWCGLGQSFQLVVTFNAGTWEQPQIRAWLTVYSGLGGGTTIYEAVFEADVDPQDCRAIDGVVLQLAYEGGNPDHCDSTNATITLTSVMLP